MTAVLGGVRTRLVQDSLLNAVRDGLAELGWFDPGRHHLPISVLTEPNAWDEPVVYNSIGLRTVSSDLEYVEVGSLLAAVDTMAFIDLYAESDSLGVDVSNDVRDILRGRVAATVPRGTLPIYDYQQATPTVIAGAPISDVIVTRALNLAGNNRTHHWFRIQCRIRDTYYSYNPG